MSASQFEERLKLLVALKCNVLSLTEALERLQNGTLPPRSVVLTFDDGFHDFYDLAHPLLKKYGFPSTLYLTTHYSNYNRPVFNVLLQYLIWKTNEKSISPQGLLGLTELIDLQDESGSTKKP